MKSKSRLSKKKSSRARLEKPVVERPVEKVVKDYDTIGVRFIFGNRADKVYTYKIKPPYNMTALHLGALLVASTPHPDGGDFIKQVCCVVEIHPEPRDTDPNIEYKFITERVAPL